MYHQWKKPLVCWLSQTHLNVTSSRKPSHPSLPLQHSKLTSVFQSLSLGDELLWGQGLTLLFTFGCLEEGLAWSPALRTCPINSPLNESIKLSMVLLQRDLLWVNCPKMTVGFSLRAKASNQSAIEGSVNRSSVSSAKLRKLWFSWRDYTYEIWGRGRIKRREGRIQLSVFTADY